MRPAVIYLRSLTFGGISHQSRQTNSGRLEIQDFGEVLLSVCPLGAGSNSYCRGVVGKVKKSLTPTGTDRF